MSHSTTLSQLEFHALLALSEGVSYGYAVQQDIIETTHGELSPTVGALYRALARFVERGWIEEREAPARAPEATPGLARRYYGLTRAGRVVLAEEAGRLQAAVDLARTRRVLPGAR